MLGVRCVVRPTEPLTSSFAEQSRKVQTPAELLSKLLLPLLLLFAAPIWGEVVDAKTEKWIINFGISRGIPTSVTRQLMIEESGKTATAISNQTLEGFHSRGLFQLYDRPSNLNWLLKKFWHSQHPFDIYNPQDNAVVALSYLAWLHTRYKTWYLALCYYNHGDIHTIPAQTRAYARRIITAR